MSETGVVYTVEVLDASKCYSFAELCEISRLTDIVVSELIDYEVIVADGPAENSFTHTQLDRLLRASRLQHDLEINTPGVALVLDLLETNQRLERHIRKLESRTILSVD